MKKKACPKKLKYNLKVNNLKWCVEYSCDYDINSEEHNKFCLEDMCRCI